MEIIKIFKEFLTINQLNKTMDIFNYEIADKINYLNYKLLYKKIKNVPKKKYIIKKDWKNIPIIKTDWNRKETKEIKYNLENTKIFNKIYTNISELTNKTIEKNMKNSILINENNTSFGCSNNITNNNITNNNITNNEVKDFSFEYKNNDVEEIKKPENDNNNLFELSFQDNLNKFGCHSDNLNTNNKKNKNKNKNNNNNIKILKSDIQPNLFFSDFSSFDLTNKNDDDNKNEFYMKFNSFENKLTKDISNLNKNYIKNDYINNEPFKKEKNKLNIDLKSEIMFDLPIYFNRKVNDEKNIANKYYLEEKIAESTFCNTFIGTNIKNKNKVCIKIIKSSKENFDQSLLEIYILKMINKNNNAKKFNFIELYDFFYFNGNLLIVSDLLGSNLYDFYIKDFYNQIKISDLSLLLKNILTCLKYLNNKGISHCDLKPENILLDNENKNNFKVIDFGSTRFFDEFSEFYIQSRPYRSPECILKINYNEKIDIWSLGCIAYELVTKNVLFDEGIEENLAKMISICGPIKQSIIKQSKNKFIYKKNCIIKENKNNVLTIMLPIINRDFLKNKIENKLLLDFIEKCLNINYDERISINDALNHPFILNN